MSNFNVIGNNEVVWRGLSNSVNEAIKTFAKDFYREWLDKDKKNTLNIYLDLPYFTVFHASDKDSDVFTIRAI